MYSDRDSDCDSNRNIKVPSLSIQNQTDSNSEVNSNSEDDGVSPWFEIISKATITSSDPSDELSPAYSSVPSYVWND